jgi:hypothetical protein
VCESLHNDSRGQSSSFTPKPSKPPAAAPSFLPDSPSEIDYLQAEGFGASIHLSKKQKFTA